MSRDEKWMGRAIALAERGRWTVSPNPMVGACVVRSGRNVGEGFHEKYGDSHAEIHALKRAGRRAHGAVLYVTLEPCATWGKTPPCIEAIVRAGIREVKIGSLDPNPRNHGKGIAALKKEGIRVQSGILARDIQKQNEAFFKFVSAKRPFVILKMAQSLDGKIATRNGRSRWISSPASRKFVHHLRAEQDAILIGKNTLLLDNPKLSPGLKKADPEKPWRIALAPNGKTRPNARIFSGKQLTMLVVPEKKFSLRPAKTGAGAPALNRIILPVRQIRGRFDVKELLKKLGSLGVAKLLVEGGGELAWSLFDAGLVDRAYWIIAPKIIGGREAKSSVEGEGVGLPSQAFGHRLIDWRRLGSDLLVQTEP